MQILKLAIKLSVDPNNIRRFIIHFEGILFKRKLFQFLNMAKITIANSADPDEMPHFVASHLGLHCLLVSHL